MTEATRPERPRIRPGQRRLLVIESRVARYRHLYEAANSWPWMALTSLLLIANAPASPAATSLAVGG